LIASRADRLHELGHGFLLRVRDVHRYGRVDRRRRLARAAGERKREKEGNLTNWN